MYLEVRNIYQSYGSMQVLQGIDFDLEKGSFLALLGPNGTGKTTLLKAIGMLQPPKSGSCILDQENIFSMSPSKRAKQVAYLPQSTAAPFSMTVVDAVLLGRSPHTSFLPKAEDREIAVSTLEQLGLGELAFRDISRMSGGERQRVFLARALTQQPKLLLLDEPTSNLDLKNQLRTMKMIRKLCSEQGLTAIAAIHDLNLAAMFCDRFLMLKDCRLLSYGGSEVLTRESILSIYGVEVDILQLDNRRFIAPRNI